MTAGGDTLEFEVSLRFTPGELLSLYRGEAREVVARASDGRVLRFPVLALRPFVRHDGIRGRFRVRCDAGQRLLGIDRLD